MSVFLMAITATNRLFWCVAGKMKHILVPPRRSTWGGTPRLEMCTVEPGPKPMARMLGGTHRSAALEVDTSRELESNGG